VTTGHLAVRVCRHPVVLAAAGGLIAVQAAYSESMAVWLRMTTRFPRRHRPETAVKLRALARHHRATAWPLAARAWPRRIAVEAEHPRALVALATPR
jgi:hypothetical protein